KDRSKYKLNIFHSQNGTSKAGIFDYINSDLGANFNAGQHNLEYSERSLTNVLLSGTQFTSVNNWEIDWKLSSSRSLMEDPDIRYTRIRTEEGRYSIGSESGYPERIWRFLEEDNLSGKIDITKEYTFLGRTAKLKFGGGYLYKQR